MELLHRSIFTCRCGKPVFFRNSRCLNCKAALGYEPELARIFALEAVPDSEEWRLSPSKGEAAEAAIAGRYLRCANFGSAGACNWLVKVADSGGGAGSQPESKPLCISCALDRTIPDLSIADNVESFRRISMAKRRLVSLLASLRLPLASRVDQDPVRGLAFDFLRSPEGGPAVMTGHSDGIITLNVAEAEDATREQIRNQLGEPYRTVLGHLRHETGHYYWDRLVAGTPFQEKFREAFGDERQDYTAALQAHYAKGPAPDWPLRFVSAYASSHPWEDWAESWAHYLHIVDTSVTAGSFGVTADAVVEIEMEPFGEEALFDPGDAGAAEFLGFLNAWVRLTAPLNELSRAMGMADFYPFVLSTSAVAKLQLVHLVVRGDASQGG